VNGLEIILTRVRYCLTALYHYSGYFKLINMKKYHRLRLLSNLIEIIEMILFILWGLSILFIESFIGLLIYYVVGIIPILFIWRKHIVKKHLKKKIYATICIFNRLLIDSISVLRAHNKSKKEEKAFK
jgi:hypothetical protein